MPEPDDDQRRLLERDAARIAEQIARLERDHLAMVAASESSNADDEHDPEGATIAYERQQLDAMIVRARSTRADLERALADLDAGRYGVCERCARPIAPERLAARPHARTCIDCARLRG